MRSAQRPPEPPAGVPGRPVPSAAPPARPTPTAAPPAAPTADSSPSPLTDAGPSISPKPLPNSPAVPPDDSGLFHVPPPDFKIRCATHLLHSRVPNRVELTAAAPQGGFGNRGHEHPQAHRRVGV